MHRRCGGGRHFRQLNPVTWRVSFSSDHANLFDHNVGRVVATGTKFFNCPNCNALYQIIKVEAGPESVDREIAWLACRRPLPWREGNSVVKYFMLRKAGRRKGDIARAVKTLA